MTERTTSLSTHPELNPNPLEPWTAVYSPAGCFLRCKENNGKFIILCFFFLKVGLTGPERNGKWWHCECVWLACSTTELRAALPRRPQLTGTWWEMQVKWSGSDQVLLRPTKLEGSTWQWIDLDGRHLLLIDLQPLTRGPQLGMLHCPE